MGEPIQVRRGPQSRLPQLNNGEIALTTDTKDVYIGTPTGNELIGGKTITSLLAEKANSSNVLFLKNGFNLQLVYPTAVQSHKLPINIYNNAGKFRTNFNVKSLKPTRTTTYYVNPILGKDTNDGLTKANAFKSIGKALSMSGDIEVRLTNGIYYYKDGWLGVDPARGISVICEKGKAKLTNSSYPRRWVEDAAYKGVYSTPTTFNGENLQTESSNLRFIVKGYENDQSAGTQLTSQSLTAIQTGTAGYIIGADTTQIRLPNNLDPNNFLDIKYAMDNVVCKANSLVDAVIYLENIEAHYGKTSPVIIQTSTVNSKIVLVATSGLHSRSSDGIELTGNGLGVLFQCEASDNYQDGFNYYVNQSVSGSGVFDVVEIECKGHNNGRDTTGTNNGSTLHSTARGIRLNCNYDGNQNRNVHDVGGGWSYNVGVKARNSQTNMEGFSSGLDSNGTADKMWLVGCDADIISAQKGATLYKETGAIFSSEFVTQTGVVTEFNPY